MQTDVSSKFQGVTLNPKAFAQSFCSLNAETAGAYPFRKKASFWRPSVGLGEREWLFFFPSISYKYLTQVFCSKA